MQLGSFESEVQAHKTKFELWDSKFIPGLGSCPPPPESCDSSIGPALVRPDSRGVDRGSRCLSCTREYQPDEYYVRTCRSSGTRDDHRFWLCMLGSWASDEECDAILKGDETHVHLESTHSTVTKEHQGV